VTTRPRVVTVPSVDHAFRAHVLFAVDRLFDATDATSLGAVAKEVRRAYPNAQVRKKDDFARLDGEQLVWYAYRDRPPEAAPRIDWWSNPDLARTVVDETGRYVGANAQAADLFGVDESTILGGRAGDFTRNEGETLASVLFDTLMRNGTLESTAVVLRPDGSEIPIIFRITRDGDGPGRHVTVMEAI